MTFDEKYKIKTRRTSYGVYIATYVIDGKTFTIQGDSEKEVLRDADFGIKELTGEKREVTVSTGRPKGTKNFVGRPYNEKDIKRLFNNIHASIIGATIISKEKTLRGVAKELLKRTVHEANFDEYTGNLTASYRAVIVSKRKIVETISFPEAVEGFEFGDIGSTKSGVRYATKRKSKYHGSPSFNKGAGKKTKTRNRRYLKKWEPSSGGYASRFNPQYTKSGHFAPAYIARGSGKVQSGVMITNDAPYASAVHRTRSRTVLKGSTAVNAVKGKWSSKSQSLVRLASKSILQKSFGRNFK